MIRIERDPAWWSAIAAHPAVSCGLLGMTPEAFGALALRPDILPMASEHGGFLFVRTDTLGFVCEGHIAFTPEGWGREATKAGIEALGGVFLCGFQVINAYQFECLPNSQPPRTFGFSPAGDWRETPHGPARLWTLTRAAWEGAPARKRRLWSVQ